MKKLVLILMFLLGYVQAKTQTYRVDTHIGDPMFYGQKFPTLIKNNGSTPVTFYVKNSEVGKEQIYRSDSLYTANLKTIFDNSPDSVAGVINVLTWLAYYEYKTDRYENNLLLVEPYVSTPGPFNSLVYNRIKSGVGSKQLKHQQCGDYANMTLQEFRRLGFPVRFLRQVGLSEHVAGEIFVGGGWIFFDLDPGTPGFIHLNPNSPNGYASATDLFNDTSLIQIRYFFQDSIDLVPYYSLAEYRMRFTELNTFFLDSLLHPEVISGDITLCSGCFISHEAVFDSSKTSSFLVLLIDTTDSAQKSAAMEMFWFMQMFSMGNPSYLDSVFAVPRRPIFGFDSLQTTRIFSKDGGIVLYNGFLDELIAYEFFLGKIPMLTYHIPSSPDSIHLPADASAPLLVNSANSLGGGVVLDSVSLPNDFSVEIWGGKIDPLNQFPPNIPIDSLHYLNDGVILPGTEVDFELSFNNFSINFMEGFEIVMVSGGSLVIETTPQGGGLPVDLLYFTADQIDSCIHLEWSTATEIDNEGFIVETSTDGINFDSIGWVPGNGNSSTQKFYFFDDCRGVLPGVVYYRLRQIDFDGNEDTTYVVSVLITSYPPTSPDQPLQIIPNPNNGIFSVIGLEGDQEVIILNDLGKQQPVFCKNGKISLDNFSRGIYVLIYRSEKESKEVRFLIE